MHAPFGSGDQVPGSAVEISGASGNTLASRDDGLYVPTPPSKSPIPRAKPATRQGTAPGHSRAAVPPPAPASARSPSKKRTTPMSSRTTKSPRK